MRALSLAAVTAIKASRAPSPATANPDACWVKYP